jgi:hypothetical protein
VYRIGGGGHLSHELRLGSSVRFSISFFTSAFLPLQLGDGLRRKRTVRVRVYPNDPRRPFVVFVVLSNLFFPTEFKKNKLHSNHLKFLPPSKSNIRQPASSNRTIVRHQQQTSTLSCQLEHQKHHIFNVNTNTTHKECRHLQTRTSRLLPAVENGRTAPPQKKSPQCCHATAILR